MTTSHNVTGAGKVLSQRMTQLIAGHVPATVCEADLDGDYGAVQGVVATCTRCGHSTESFGTGEPSVRRCLALLRRECPNRERHYYFDDGCQADMYAVPARALVA